MGPYPATSSRAAKVLGNGGVAGSRLRARLAFAGLLVFGAAPAQTPPPADAHAGIEPPLAHLAREGRTLLERERVLQARELFRMLRARAPDDLDGLLGLGEAHLLLGRAELCVRYATIARRAEPAAGAAAALHVRGLIRGRAFERAAEVSQRALEAGLGGADLLAAHGSALFRLQRIDGAALAYRSVLALEPLHAEAHLRLGSGLTAPCAFVPSEVLQRGAAALQRGDFALAVDSFRAALADNENDPVAHRLLGEALLRASASAGLAATDPAYAALRAALPPPPAPGPGVEKLLPAHPRLEAARRAVVERALALFAPHLPKLIAIGGRHDLLGELERTTDAIERAPLRGRRTFDGRVWDDVRGMGGLRAATGIEALDDARGFGFDTLVHELAHQVHLFVLPRVERERIRELYRRARETNAFLDYYAASNEAEYFGQGVEAFASYGKRPGGEPTHGHTRFELYRCDRALHDLIAGLVSWDPLRDPRARQAILRAAVDVALVSGRPQDAVVAAEMMEPGAERERLRAQALRAALVDRPY
jgi:tetratricopeptide (TPR) repeat protein